MLEGPPRTRLAPHGVSARLATAAVVFLALLVHAPSLGLGFLADDFGMQLVLEGRVESPTWKPWSLYDFGTLAAASEQDLERAAFPWWTDPDWRVRFLRPVTSLTLWLDHALFGSAAVWGHAVSLGLLACTLVAALRLYLRLGLPRRAALVALLVLAFDNGALMPVGWLANRNSLLEALLAVLAIDQGLRAREGRSAGRACAAIALALLAVGAKESGLHVLAVLALVFFRDGAPQSNASRMPLAALACAALALAYVVFYAASGYGANVGFYPSPWTDPLELARRSLAMLACTPIAAATPWPVDALAIHPEQAPALLAFAVLAGAPIAFLVARRVRSSPHSGLLLAWGLLALVPQAGAPPSDRLMFTPMLAFAPLLALFLAGAWPGAAREALPRVERWAARAIAVCALLLSPLMVLGLGLSLVRGARALRTVIREADVGPASLGERHAFVLQASPSSLVTLAPLSTWLALGGDEGVRFLPVQSGRRALLWTRLDERSFAVESRDEPFLTHPFESVFLTRPPERAEPIVRELPACTVRAVGPAGGAPTRLEFTCASDLDDPHWRFLVFDGQRLVHRPPPAVGETLALERGFKDPFLP